VTYKEFTNVFAFLFDPIVSSKSFDGKIFGSLLDFLSLDCFFHDIDAIISGNFNYIWVLNIYFKESEHRIMKLLFSEKSVQILEAFFPHLV